MVTQDCDSSTQQAKAGLWVGCHHQLHSQTLCQKTQNGNNQVITTDNDMDLTNFSYMSKNSKRVLKIRFIKPSVLC